MKPVKRETMRCANCRHPKLALFYYKDKLYCMDCKKGFILPTSPGSSPTLNGVKQSEKNL
jgi:hypothetical protein